MLKQVSLHISLSCLQQSAASNMHDSFVGSMTIVGGNLLQIDQDISHDEPVA